MLPGIRSSWTVSTDLKLYPADHPVWQDINFTPEDVYSKVEAVRCRKGAAPQVDTHSTAGGGGWQGAAMRVCHPGA